MGVTPAHERGARASSAMKKRPLREKRLEVGDQVVTVRPTLARHPAKYLYEVLVGDEHRGWIGYIDDRRVRWRRWRAYTHLPRPTHYGTALLGQWGEANIAGDTLLDIAANFPAAVQAGQLPTESQALTILQAADQARRDDKARYARQDAERKREAAEFDRQQAEALEAVQSIRTWSEDGKLSNFEISGLEWLIANLAKLKRR